MTIPPPDPAPGAAQPPLPADGGLLARIEAVRRRYRWRLAIEAALWAAAGVALTVLAARLIGRPAGPWPWLVGAGLAAAGIAIAAARTPTLARAARRIDAGLRLHERTASAREVRGHWPRDRGPVAHALLRDAAAEAGTIRPAELVPLLPVRARWGAAALAAAVAGLLAAHAVMPPAGPAPAEVTADPAPASPTGAVVEDVRLMAELVGAAARRMDEDTLYAVERALDQLAEDAGRGIDQAELDARLTEIVQEAAVGFGRSQPSWLPPQLDDLGALGEAMAAYQAELEAARRANEALAAHNVEVFRKVWEEQQAAGAVAEAARLADGVALGADADPLAGTMPPDLGAQGLPPGDSEAGTPAGAGARMPAGAAQESEGGGGDAAGLGNQPLAGEEAFVELAAEPLAEMALPLA
ncbi:MAG TPA: hypothetical protein VM891_14565, partial [Amaricoccus sp.]|nr:hypothetical protein [Amaricoccus sp.]